ncbi:hypothetical protein IJG76_00295 [Candidatus Saccharibacteria bacterium]|nr:hypothetical protein [Candidatus Saccharibacteria bacterium]
MTFRRFLYTVILGTLIVVTLFTGRVMASSASDIARAGIEAIRIDGMPTELLGDHGIVTRITNLILASIGIISVIMIIFGGIRYIVSGGDSKKVTDAKNTILYAIIGLVICLLSYAIVNFVLSTLSL